MTTRLRFAPSPTGALHLGGARTALFNWLYARHTGGKFLLRIEDTDQDRSTDASRQTILEGLAWLGITPDDEIVIQSERMQEHIRIAHSLVAEGKAYRCYCTSEALETMRETAMAEGRKPKYDGTCRELAPVGDDGRPYTVRFKMYEGTTTFDDIVLGTVSVNHEELDDLILLRSDGTPTYNFVVVCDDAHMQITHVVRGQDHVNNTFRQINLYQALGYEVPRFAHLPLIDGLSKRKGSASVTAYGEAGFLPEAVINYIARLGWSHGDDEIFTVDELIALFDLEDVNKASGTFDDAKLTWVNHQWMMRLAPEDAAQRLAGYLAKRGIETAVDARLIALAGVLQERSTTMLEMVERAMFAFVAPTAFDEKATKKFLVAENLAAFEALIAALDANPEFSHDSIEAALQSVLAAHPIGMGKIAQPVRIALTGGIASPGIHDTMLAAGREQVIARMRSLTQMFV